MPFISNLSIRLYKSAKKRILCVEKSVEFYGREYKCKKFDGKRDRDRQGL